MSKNRPHMMPRKYLDTADVITKDLTRKQSRNETVHFTVG